MQENQPSLLQLSKPPMLEPTEVDRLANFTRAPVPSDMLQSYRTALAAARGVERNLVFHTWGGIGDQICAEPVLRYALEAFKHCEISLASELPELFTHLQFKDVFDLKREQPIWPRYLRFDTIVPPTHVLWEFMCHMLVNAVDYSAICALRCQLPVAAREIKLVPNDVEEDRAIELLRGTTLPVAIHPGKHWQSKTFPADWWDGVIDCLKRANITPVIVGGAADDNRTTVDVDATGCLDLRGQVSLMESVAVLQRVRALLTNDSAPLHMAASGAAWIGFVATCKHPDYVMHWRNGAWAWRMQNLGLDGLWNHVSHCPNVVDGLSAENVGDELLRSWLPDPKSVALWALERLR